MTNRPTENESCSECRPEYIVSLDTKAWPRWCDECGKVTMHLFENHPVVPDETGYRNQ